MGPVNKLISLPNIKPRSNSILFFGNNWLCLLVGLQQILVACEHLVEVLDLLAVPDRLDDVEQNLVPFLFVVSNHAFVVSFFVG